MFRASSSQVFESEFMNLIHEERRGRDRASDAGSSSIFDAGWVDITVLFVSASLKRRGSLLQHDSASATSLEVRRARSLGTQLGFLGVFPGGPRPRKGGLMR